MRHGKFIGQENNEFSGSGVVANELEEIIA